MYLQISIKGKLKEKVEIKAPMTHCPSNSEHQC